MTVRSTTRLPRRGGVTVWLAISLTAIIGILALGMDAGRMMEERRHARAAADAAALAGAKQAYDLLTQNASQPPSATVIQQAAVQNAAANGYANDGVNSIVTAQVGPSSGPFQGNTNYIEVIVQ